MKPAIFAYCRAASVADALALLTAADGDASLIAGGQSLGPLLNLRMSAAAQVIDIAALPELRQCRDFDDCIFIGAGVTHAQIEDGKIPNATHGFMQRAAGKIAYRAIRCHGTIGGSVAMADPAADWPCILLALDAAAVAATGLAGDGVTATAAGSGASGAGASNSNRKESDSGVMAHNRASPST